MDYFIPTHMSGRFATQVQRDAAVKAGRDPDAVGTPYEFFRGIHHVPEALADSHHANALGIVPVEEMSDEDWRLLGLDRDKWMEANRLQPEEAEDGGKAPETVEQPIEAEKSSTAL